MMRIKKKQAWRLAGRYTWAVLSGLTVAMGAHAQQRGVSAPPVTTQGVALKDLPFSPAMQAGNTLYTAGQIGTDGSDRLVPGGIRPEAKKALQNITKVVGENGFTLKDIVKCTVFLADMAEVSEFNEVYKTFFSPPYPARSALGVSGLAMNARVEVECIAYKLGAHNGARPLRKGAAQLMGTVPSAGQGQAF
ncbi:RidA family protein [Burkholderia pyrrocinia]